MQNFPIMAMKPGNPVIVHVNGKIAAKGTVVGWNNHQGNGGWVVTVANASGAQTHYWVQQGATFYHP